DQSPSSSLVCNDKYDTDQESEARPSINDIGDSEIIDPNSEDEFVRADAIEPNEEIQLKESEHIFKRPVFNVPADILEHFDYVGHVIGSNTQKDIVLMNCKICEAKNQKYVVRGPAFFNCRRHIQAAHPDFAKGGKV
ncbi:unnamed protein product, partial [Allacma fusca]